MPAKGNGKKKAMAEAGRLFRSRGRQPGTLKRVPPQAAKKKK